MWPVWGGTGDTSPKCGRPWPRSPVDGRYHRVDTAYWHAPCWGLPERPGENQGGWSSGRPALSAQASSACC